MALINGIDAYFYQGASGSTPSTLLANVRDATVNYGTIEADVTVKQSGFTLTDVVRHDGDDPYLVVAADKGTATFSDTANALSFDKHHWLGDAFASGGSGLPSYSAGLNTAYMNTASGYTAYWTRMACHTNAAATNNGSNYWTVTVQGINLAASAGTTILAFDTSADTAGVRTNHSATVSSGNALPTNNYFVSAILAKVGTPGNLEMTMVMHHKYVVT